MYCQLVHQNKIHFKTESNYNSIIATEDIEPGELLLIEHVICTKILMLHSLMLFIPEIFNDYHPRDKTYDECDLNERIVFVREKIKHNIFKLDTKVLLTKYITRINHSCQPNCMVHIQKKHQLGDSTVVFMELISLKKIHKGEEIFINYGPETAHNRDFECCDLDIDTRRKIYQTSSVVLNHYQKNLVDPINDKIEDYLSGSDSDLTSHFLLDLGVFLIGSEVKGYTKDGERLINQIIQNKMNIDFDQYNFEITKPKLDLFVRMIRQSNPLV